MSKKKYGSLVKHLNQRTCLRNIKKDYSKQDTLTWALKTTTKSCKKRRFKTQYNNA